MMIGGAHIYQHFLTYADKMYLTEIDASFKQADTYFPDFCENDWWKEILKEQQEGKIKYKHLMYTRKNTYKKN